MVLVWRLGPGPPSVELACGLPLTSNVSEERLLQGNDFRAPKGRKGSAPGRHEDNTLHDKGELTRPTA
jgi:hypothetical protein